MSTTAPDAPASQHSPATRVPHRWRNLATLTGSTAVDSTEGSLIGTLFPSIAASLGLNSGHLGTMTALGKLASAPAGPLWTWLAACTSRKTVLVTTSLLGGAFGIASAFSTGYISLLVLNVLMAAALVGASPVGNALILDCFSDRERARAMSYFYGAINGIASLMGPLIGLFSLSEDGWRYGLATMGSIAALAGVAQLVLIKDPGVGASEPEFADLASGRRVREKTSLRAILGLFRVRSYSLMMLSRLLSGHLLISVYGVTFLVDERGFSNALAATVLLPFGIGYLVGTLGGGMLVGVLDRVMPRHGRIWYIQLAQILFAVAAMVATQLHLGGILAYAVLWALMGAAQGMNPPVNRPIVAAVIPPKLRGQAMAVFITVFETIGWALFSFGAGQFAVTHGIQSVFFWVLGVLMVVNALVLGLLHLTYPRDVAAATADRERDREATLGASG
ncbi:MFS transporter [Brachybacterium sp. YJGR34]|uniref:MFS transporter n=1 Tax=Brachybacterium sp. YJGR34 TaxID=2059911 RepID=UPI000E0CAB4D|nr:MFS transporter [Brachybacterium sp. YJGR34]